MSHRTGRRRTAPSTAALSFVVAATVGVLGSCGGADDGTTPGAPSPADDATSSTSAGATSAPSADPGSSTGSTPGSPSATAEPTAEPTVAPATGPVIRGSSFRLRAPEGWTIADPVSDFVRLATEPSGSGDIIVGFLEADDQATTDSLEQIAAQLWRGPQRPRTEPRTEVGGVELYHLSGRSETGGRLDEYGAEVGGLGFNITFDLPGTTPTERRAVIDSVLASIEWR